MHTQSSINSICNQFNERAAKNQLIAGAFLLICVSTPVLANTPISPPLEPPPYFERQILPLPTPFRPRAATLYSHGNPTAEEQLLLEMVNRARANPPAEGARLASTTDPDVLSAYSFFNVNLAQLQSQFNSYPVRPPIAFNASLITAARLHSQDMAANNFQGHNGSNGSTLVQRIESAGYTGWTSAGENVYAYSKSVFFGHAGLNVDWGVPSLGHRKSIMNFEANSPIFREIGIGIVSESNPATDVGPLVITQDFGKSSSIFVVGVAYQDLNKDGFYSTGEGLPNVSITTSIGDFYAVTSQSGGYAIPLTQTQGSLTVTASGGGFSPTVQSVNLNGANVKADFVLGTSSTGSTSKVGVFRNGQWYLDANGNGAWDGCGTEFCFSGFGQTGDLPAAGNWDGGAKSYIGVLRSGTGQWFIDRNGNRQWDGCVADGCYSGFGAPGDLPVAGDWNGSGFAKIGVFRNGQWFLDANGNGAWDGCGTELCLSFGQAGDLPMAGHWDGGSKAGVGVFRAGTWYLDYNGNGAWEGCGIDRCYFGSFGQDGDLPAAGDWNGDGKAKVGVFRNGTWYLDYNGNGVWDGCGVDRCYVGSFGQQGDWPVAGKW